VRVSGLEASTFQSTPLREGRPPPELEATPTSGFNPRPCVRGDNRGWRVVWQSKTFQSTPLREGRLGAAVWCGGSIRFQSTPLREGRPAPNRLSSCSCMFQSTPLREGRQAEAVVGMLGAAFQSTPLREGRLAVVRQRVEDLVVSIHAPA